MVRKRLGLAAMLLGIGCAPAHASAAAQPKSILFVGNSFTFGADSPVRGYRAHSVEDLNQSGMGGVPALFKRFAEQSGLDYRVVVEAKGGANLAWHLAERRDLIDRPWDHVVLQEYSTLDTQKRGDSAHFLADARTLGDMFAARNSAVDIRLTATWSRPDLVYRGVTPWAGPIEKMANMLRAAYDRAAQAIGARARVVPVGQAFTCAIRANVADANPYDGIAAGRVDLWAHDHYHASSHGYYLEALMLFGSVTGRDPRELGAREQAAADLGLAQGEALQLQAVAQAALAGDGACGK